MASACTGTYTCNSLSPTKRKCTPSLKPQRHLPVATGSKSEAEGDHMSRGGTVLCCSRVLHCLTEIFNSCAEALPDDEEESSPYAQTTVSFEDVGLGGSLRNTLAKAGRLRPSLIQLQCLLSLTHVSGIHLYMCQAWQALQLNQGRPQNSFFCKRTSEGSAKTYFFKQNSGLSIWR